RPCLPLASLFPYTTRFRSLEVINFHFRGAACHQPYRSITNCTFHFPILSRTIKSLEKCIKDYSTRCLRGETRNSISVIIYGVTKDRKSTRLNSSHVSISYA